MQILYSPALPPHILMFTPRLFTLVGWRSYRVTKYPRQERFDLLKSEYVRFCALLGYRWQKFCFLNCTSHLTHYIFGFIDSICLYLNDIHHQDIEEIHVGNAFIYAAPTCTSRILWLCIFLVNEKSWL